MLPWKDGVPAKTRPATRATNARNLKDNQRSRVSEVTSDWSRETMAAKLSNIEEEVTARNRNLNLR
eukprot:2436514-Amphidinium_carterae.1